MRLVAEFVEENVIELIEIDSESLFQYRLGCHFWFFYILSNYLLVFLFYYVFLATLKVMVYH